MKPIRMLQIIILTLCIVLTAGCDSAGEPDVPSQPASAAEGPAETGAPEGSGETAAPEGTGEPETSEEGTQEPETPEAGTEAPSGEEGASGEEESSEEGGAAGEGESISAPEESATEGEQETEPPAPEETEMDPGALEEEAEAIFTAPAVSTVLTPTAPGTQEKRGSKAVIDYSNAADGYVMTQYTASTSQRLKVQVKGPTTTYTYDLTAGQWEVFPLSDGNGSYQIGVYENVSGTKYAAVESVTLSVTLADEFAPFLRPNQYVDYSASSSAVDKAARLCAGISDTLEKVKVIYEFVVSNLTYDKEKAATVQSGYLPVLDTVLAEKKGICFDYAALMTGMLRSQGVPCKLVVGYAGSAYHAWISVWTEKDGWIDGAIYFDGNTWQRMDPTFASSGDQSEAIMAYIGDGKNYTVKYLY